jgi:transposase
MLGLQQFRKLQEYKELGLSRLKVAEKLNLSYKTVCNWWDRDEEFFERFQKEHEFVLDNYRQYIIEILKICPQINNMVLLRRVKDDFSDFDIPAATFFRYVKKVREQTGLLKPARKFAVREVTEPGYEGQVDFGQYVMKTMYGRNIRIYFFSMVLSYSRMKFAYFSAEPFDAKKTIEGHVYAFRYFGGRPQMIVYDQDKTMVVSENLGDVIFVREFEDFIRETGFSIYLCRGYDPSTKGKVEKTVDFVKHQFLDGRIYYGIDRLNCEFMDWLDREGNGLINDITKKGPRDMFKKEYPKLIKYYERRNDESVVHTVYHDTIEYRENLYKLPLGNINDGDRIRIERYDDQLLFYHATTNELVCKHKLLNGKGNIVTLPKAEKEELSIE